MLSRVANSVYWLGRYLERSENYSRFIDVNFNLMVDLPPNVKEQWEPLIRATGDYDLYIKNYESFNREDAIYFMLLMRIIQIPSTCLYPRQGKMRGLSGKT
jgi:uncharacterized alpha-E superfamily protein